MNCPNNKSRNCCSGCGSCGTYVTIQGPPGPMGPEVPCGEQGPQGEKGDTGETPVITVVEDTPLSYKLNFKTSEDDITTPSSGRCVKSAPLSQTEAQEPLSGYNGARLMSAMMHRQLS